MQQYTLQTSMQPLTEAPVPEAKVLILFTSDELTHAQYIPAMERIIQHTPSARDVRTCKVEQHGDFLRGSIMTPHSTKEGHRIAFGFLLTATQLVLCDDSGAISAAACDLAADKQWPDNSPMRFFCAILEWLLSAEPRRIESLENRLGLLEDEILTASSGNFNARITAMRKEALLFFRYYTQLCDMVCQMQEDEYDGIRDSDRALLHALEKRLTRLRDEAQLLREYCLAVRELFQAEVDIRQNRIMKILTIVTTLCLPLSLVAGWYGMNFSGMPELEWKYGYPAVIAVSVLIVGLSLWIMKKKKFL